MENSKIYTIFAGINGAGKSTLYYTLGEENFGVRLNSDEIVASLGNDWKSPTIQYRAGKQLLALQEQCLEQGLPFNRETTLGGLSILNSIKQAKQKGYKINLYYIGVDNLDIAKRRVLKRVNMGGHGVDEETIEYRNRVIEKNLIRILPYLDSIQIFDNSSSGIDMVAYKNEGEFIKTRNDCKWLDKLLLEIEQQKALS